MNSFFRFVLPTIKKQYVDTPRHNVIEDFLLTRLLQLIQTKNECDNSKREADKFKKEVDLLKQEIKRMKKDDVEKVYRY